MLFVFGEYTLDVDRRELRREGIIRPLEPKAFLVLMHLLTQRQRAVSKDELLAMCWPHEFVTEAALTRCLRVIRQAVADDGVRQHVIKTLRGYGYRFVAAVEERPTLPPASTARVPDGPLPQVESPRRAAATLHTPDRHASTPPVTPPTRLADNLLAMRRAVAGERKQVTVLCAVIVAGSMLAEYLNAEDLQTLIGGCFALLAEQVQRYEGTLTQFTSDGLMALFGVPIAHEDHAGRALHAALGRS
jgi:DNA-binding winged helix-turn-helix (wHTH) protein